MLSINALSSALRADLSHHVDLDNPPDVHAAPWVHACHILNTTFLKKYMPLGKIPKEAERAAIEKFISVNDRMKGFRLTPNLSIDEVLIGEVKRELYDFFWVDGDTSLFPTPLAIWERGGVGPGQSLGCTGVDSYSKLFSSVLSGTKDALRFWELCIGYHPRWWEASAETHRTLGASTKVVTCAKLSVVPKYATIARCIATEPTTNMWFQQGIKEILQDRLKSFFGIDLATQQGLNRELAREGSFSDSFATIDLESASDSLGYNLMREILPPDFFGVLDLFRSPAVSLPPGFGGRVRCHMISSMGNAFTFPLQCILFASIVRSVYRILHVPMRKGIGGLSPTNNYAVNGDDIIVVNEASRLTIRALELFGLVVNKDKTFVEGRFRESCGADYVDGVNVRGFYLKHLQNKQDIYVALNGLLSWSALHEVPLPTTMRMLKHGLGGNIRYVPLHENPTAGLHTPSSCLPDSSRRTDTRGLSHYQCYVPHTLTLSVDCSDGNPTVLVPEGARARVYNHTGWLLVACAGFARGGKIALRQKRDLLRYTTKSKVTPCWDYQDPRVDVDPNIGSRLRRLTHSWRQNLARSSSISR